MENNRRTIIVSGLVLLAAAGMAGLVYRDVADSNSGAITVENGSQLGENITVEKLTPPDISKKITFPASMPEAIRKDTLMRIEALKKQLAERPEAAAGVWNDLGLFYKLIEDY